MKLALSIVLALVLLSSCRRGEQRATIMPAPETASPAMVDPWKAAALKVEEDRGEPTGRQAKIEIPSQLRHYSDRKRFLAIQVAEWRKHDFQTPHDFAELVTLIRQGEMIEVPPLGENYILYGVGLSASDEPFTHYDKKTGRSVTLYGSDAELEQEYNQLAESLKQFGEATDALRDEMAALPKSDRALRTTLQSEIAEKERLAAALKKRKELLDDFYQKPETRQLLASEYESLAALARDFGGRTYDLQDAASRKAYKVRLLSFIRPNALKVLEDVARVYHEKFERHLPITSLVRPDEYQRELSETNPNATLIEVPPHTTGLAGDIFNRFMTAEEQNFIMAELARLKDEGRIEVLRENRDHWHVFAFVEGKPPDEELIRKSLGGAAASEPVKEKERPAKKEKQRSAKARRPAKKETRPTKKRAAQTRR